MSSVEVDSNKSGKLNLIKSNNMQLNKRLIFSCACGLFTVASIHCSLGLCADRPQHEKVLLDQIDVSGFPANGKLAVGDMIRLGYEFSEVNPLNSIQIYLDNQLLRSCNEKSCRIEYSTEHERVGEHRIEVRISDRNGNRKVQIPMELISDIVPVNLSYEIVNVYPHDPTAFTQGLFFHQGELYESTGIWGMSSLRRVKLETGEVLQKQLIAHPYFAEGITRYRDKIIQLTWQNRVGFIYDIKSFTKLGEFQYATQGWGIATMGDLFYMSDGSQNLFILSADDYHELKQIQVYDNKGPVQGVNELEFIKGAIFANIFATSKIAKIEVDSGKVVAWLNLEDLLSADERVSTNDVLNGIAYDEQNERIFVTGKNWQKLFEIKVR